MMIPTIPGWKVETIGDDIAVLHPSDVVSDGLVVPPRYGRDHHGEVCLAAGRGERASEILGLTGGVGHLEDEHVFRHPAFIPGLHRSDAQRVTLLAEQCIATVAGAVGPDLTRFREVANVFFLRIVWPSRVCLVGSH